jgi:hypothetical protein
LPLLIQTTGLEDYAPGGNARVKVLNIGGPGAGKTRFSSFFPAPIFADCERGLASVADRKVPYVNINNSQDMLDLLAYLKTECRLPQDKRQYHTIVIDTLDAFQRKVKNEWMEINKKEVFTGYEAWGYLTTKTQLLMTRLLNLDMNVVCNVHFKDKTVKDNVSGRESHELMLQLQGETADTAFNDFDLVGWTGVYWESEDGQRVQKRGITFKPTPDKPFLKDRLHVTPDWLPITFADSDYTNLFERIQARVQEMDAGEVLGEVPSAVPEAPSQFVMTPGAIGTGAMPATAPRDVPLQQLDKPTLMKKARDLGITTTVEGTPIRANTLKSELLAALEANLAGQAPTAAATPAPAEQPAPAPSASPAPAEPAQPEQPTQAARQAVTTRATDQGTVNVATGELLDTTTATAVAVMDRPVVAPEIGTEPVTEPPTHEQALATVAETLGGEVIEDKAVPVPAPAAAPPAPPSPTPAPAPASDAGHCQECGKSLAGEDPDIVKLSWIKYRTKLCNADYQIRKRG